jgi:DNA repair exonuclease SbcCD ATPase subunit
MDTKQWNTLVNESIAACDMSDIIQQADEWFKQGFEYWKAWGAIASFYAAPQTWLEAAGGVPKTMDNYLKDWTRMYGLGRDSALEKDLAAHKRQAKKIDAALQKIKKEKATLKRTLTLKEKTLKAQRADIDQYQKRLREKEKEIQTLQAEVKVQAERLIKLEATGKKGAESSAPSKK